MIDNERCSPRDDWFAEYGQQNLVFLTEQLSHFMYIFASYRVSTLCHTRNFKQ